MTITIHGRNDAPVLGDTTTPLTGTDEDTASTGQLVSSFLASSDVDMGALSGVAVTGTTGNGT